MFPAGQRPVLPKNHKFHFSKSPAFRVICERFGDEAQIQKKESHHAQFEARPESCP
jgi:hypothetical protein